MDKYEDDYEDEIRRLCLVCLAHIYDAEVPSCELRGTLYNALVYQLRLCSKDELSKLFDDMRCVAELGGRVRLSAKFGWSAAKLSEADHERYKTALKDVKAMLYRVVEKL